MAKKITKKDCAKDVKELIEVMNLVGAFSDILKVMLPEVLPNSSSLVQKTFDLFMTKENIKSFRDLTVEIYLRHYSPSEIKTMLKYYKSKDGKSIVRKTMSVASDFSLSTRQWSLKIIEDSQDKISSLIDEQIALEREKSENKMYVPKISDIRNQNSQKD